MRSHALTRLSLASLLLLSLSACGVGNRQSPVATDDEAGLTKPVQIEEDKPSTYVTKAGDTLMSVAGRDEIYGEPDLWPAILDANQASLGDQTGRSRLAAGISLAIPRGLDDAALADAREKARQAAAATKATHKPKSMEAPMAKAERAEPVRVAKAAPAPVAKAPVKAPVKLAAKPQAKPAVKAVAAADSARPVPKAKRSGGLLPVLFFLLLLLAVLAAVLFYFTRRDQKDAEG